MIHPPVYPDLSDWPIYKLSEDRADFLDKIDDFTYQRLKNTHTINELNDLIASVAYQERTRMKEDPWKVDPPTDWQFWSKVNKKLVEAMDAPTGSEASIKQEQILRRIIRRYSEEIVGTFRISTFKFARKFLTAFFGRLLNAASTKSFSRLIFGGKLRVLDRFKIEGDIPQIQNLMKHGTVIVVPTHFSNLDSILVGYVMDAVLGLPSFSYGAGLNLYNNGGPAYFMNRLGAYRVDRRKKNPVYLETLKAMSKLSIQRGVNSLFFPGGTRSRSGGLETKLKMGLLGTVVEAQRALCEEKSDKKIFIVPLVMSYHFVLEGQSLIESYLRSIGKERYLKVSNDEFYSVRKLLKYAWLFFAEDSDFSFSFGKPIDVMGNFVDFDGNSHDRHGNSIDIKEYFMANGAITADLQREEQYTKLLADKIVERYFKENIVLSSHLVAFVAFNMLKAQHPKLDLYALLRLPEDVLVLNRAHFTEVVGQLQARLSAMEMKGYLKISEQIHWLTPDLVQHGVQELGIYHIRKALEFNAQGDIVSHNFKLLFFYHNRLENYGLDKRMGA
jgi:glycerol-3-phosphate O-acyltransferase